MIDSLETDIAADKKDKENLTASAILIIIISL